MPVSLALPISFRLVHGGRTSTCLFLSCKRAGNVALNDDSCTPSFAVTAAKSSAGKTERQNGLRAGYTAALSRLPDSSMRRPRASNHVAAGGHVPRNPVVKLLYVASRSCSRTEAAALEIVTGFFVGPFGS